jgi:drug/metabolite transporter, DME family
MSVMPKSGRAGLSQLVASGLLFGAGAPIAGLLIRTAGLSPVAVAAYRLAVGGMLIAAFLTCLGNRFPRGRAAWTRIAVMAALSAGCQACYFVAATFSSVTLAVLITIGLSPVLVLTVEWLSGRRGWDRRMAGAIALALTGLALLVGLPSGDGRPMITALLSLLAALCFTGMTVIGSRPVSGVDELTTIGFGLGTGGLLLIPLTSLSFHPDATALGLLVLLCTVPTGVAYVLFFRGIRQAGASAGAVLILLEPLSGSVLAALLLGDRLTPLGIVGAGLLAVAMIIASRS